MTFLFRTLASGKSINNEVEGERLETGDELRICSKIRDHVDMENWTQILEAVEVK